MTGMFEILSKEALNPTVVRIAVSAPRIARKAEPGQFVILRAKEQSERSPLTVADYDREAGTVTVIYQIVGAGTMELNTLNAGDCLHDLVGPLGTPTRTEGLKKVCIVGGGVGCAIAYPVAKKLHGLGCTVHSVVGFRSRDLVILEDEFRGVSEELRLMTDDGSYGEKGLVTNALEKLIRAGNQYDQVIAIGPLIMMKFVCKLTEKYGIKTVVSMNPIMIDGTGMCGGCRLTVGGGNVAMDAARCAKRLGAEEVFIVYRRGLEEMPARREEVEHAQEEGIIFHTLCNPVEVLGDENGNVCGMRCVRMTLGEPDESGRRRPIVQEGSDFVLDVDTMIMSIGTSPNPLIRSTTPRLEADRRGCLIVQGESGLTTREGVYAGGDAVTGAATVILAMGAGKNAAQAIDEYIHQKG